MKHHASLLHAIENEYQVQNAQSLNCFHELHECFYFNNKGTYYSLLNTEKHTPSHLMITIGHTTYLVTVHNQSKSSRLLSTHTCQCHLFFTPLHINSLVYIGVNTQRIISSCCCPPRTEIGASESGPFPPEMPWPKRHQKLVALIQRLHWQY